MRTILITLFSIALFGVANGQSIERQVIGSAGVAVISSDVILDMTIGESVTTSKLNPSVSLSQGFQQGFTGEVSASIELLDLNTSISVFPNPAISYLNIRSDLNKQGISMLNYDIISAQGQIVSKGEINASTATIDINNFASGGYVLKLYDRQTGFVRNIRFVKF